MSYRRHWRTIKSNPGEKMRHNLTRQTAHAVQYRLDGQNDVWYFSSPFWDSLILLFRLNWILCIAQSSPSQPSMTAEMFTVSQSSTNTHPSCLQTVSFMPKLIKCNHSLLILYKYWTNVISQQQQACIHMYFLDRVTIFTSLWNLISFPHLGLLFLYSSKCHLKLFICII